MSNHPQESLTNFGDLPDTAYVRLATVRVLLACSNATVWRLSKEGKIPQPIKLSSHITGWNVGELRHYLHTKMLERGNGDSK